MVQHAFPETQPLPTGRVAGASRPESPTLARCVYSHTKTQHRPENKFSVPEEFCPFVQETGAKDE